MFDSSAGAEAACEKNWQPRLNSNDAAVVCQTVLAFRIM
jgi:hypothetical protein